MAYIFLLGALAAAVAFDLIRRALLPRTSLRGKHALVTGGSSGIGKALAARLLARGARVTLLARTQHKLHAAAEELRAALPDAQVQYVCASTTSSEQLAAALHAASAAFGAVDVLVANAGAAAPGLFLEMPLSTFEAQMELNYMGTVRSVKAVLPQMVARRGGNVVIVASGAAVVSFMGYTSYAPTKWALRGFADALRNEVCGFGVGIHIAYPPDTETPGFEHENQTKPVETAAMVPVDVYPAEKVAHSIVRGLETGLYHLPGPDPLLNLLVSTMGGVSPRAYVFLEVALLPIAALVEAAVSVYFDYWGRKYARRHAEEEAKKAA
ncbi:hypothetical protein AB1Y20_012613 [Prymnesium parvum]|uniref:3-dehydrosphinganine reductase n=1 Tax=Prymnesium parvum TaxID=97485 RepID=A0AB34ILY6_PRYPA